MKSRDSFRSYGLLGVRGILILLFVLSGTGKLIDGQNAAHLIELVFEGAPRISGRSGPLVVLVSGAELVLAGALIWARHLSLALWSSFGVIASFTVALATLLKGADVASCGCFGIFGLPLSLKATILRNLVLLALILTGILLVGTRPRNGS